MSQTYERKTTENLQFRYLYGLGVLFVVLSHCNGGGVQMLSNWMHFGAFHLAIFVFGSGYFFDARKLEKPMQYWNDKVKKLLLPLWGWNLFYGLLIQILHKAGFTFGSSLNLKNVLLGPVINQDLYVLNLGSWFVFPFFMVQILYACFKWILDKAGKSGVTDKLLQGVFLIAGMVGVYVTPMMKQPWWDMACRILYFMPFYVMGMLYKQYLEKSIRQVPAVVVLGFCMLYNLCIKTWFGREVYAIPSSCDYPFGMAATYLTAIIDILFWLKVCQVLADHKKICTPLAVLGRCTWEIMIHQFMGILLVKGVFALGNSLFGWFTDFQWQEFYGNIWYLYLPKGILEYAFLYVIGALLIPIGIKWGMNRFKKEAAKIGERYGAKNKGAYAKS